MGFSAVRTMVDGELPDTALSIDDLGSRIVGLAGRLASATCRWLLLVAEFDARDGCARFGLASTARWLAHYCGLSRRTAVEHVRVARALAAFPLLADAMAVGRLSYSDVRAISRLPDDGEGQLVADLIEVAEHGTVGQLETMVRGMRTVEHHRSAAAQLPPQEYVSHCWSTQSQWRLNARLDPEHGAVVQSAIEIVARAEQLTHAEALVRIAEIALAALTDAGAAPRGLRGDERAAVVVHLTTADLPAEATAEHCQPRSAERTRPYARIAGGPGLPDPVAKRLLCSGRIRTVVHDAHGNIRDLGRSHRTVSDRLFRALGLFS